MAAGIYQKSSSGEWVLSDQQFAKSGNTWKQALETYRKTGASTWTKIIDYDTVPPGIPVYNKNIPDTAAGTLTTYIDMPTDADTVGAVLKLKWLSGYPTDPYSKSDTHAAIQEDGQSYSYITAGPGQRVKRVLRLGDSPAGHVYSLACWAKDDSGNFSIPNHYQFTFPAPAPAARKLVNKEAWISCTGSGTWNFTQQYWRSDNNYVYQGGPNQPDGMWFYGTNIAAVLANAHEVGGAAIFLHRHNSAHGVSGKARIMLKWHGLTHKPGGSPGWQNDVGHIASLYRNESGWFTLPTWLHDGLKSGQVRGFGLWADKTTVTSDLYAYLYGGGTSGGQIYLRWTEYA